jgi:tetratricopeptide (TPR) repeat protein
MGQSRDDESEEWFDRGNVLSKLGRYEEAISSYDRAIEIKPDKHEAWSSRGITIGILHGYQAEINSHHQAFQHIHPDTHPEGWGFLQHLIGRTHYQEGNDRLYRVSIDDRCL